VICPHSKVEESFNVQATHDLYYHGVGKAFSWFLGKVDKSSLPYDHIRYPGVVPRTFAGPLVLAYALRFVSAITSPVFSLSSHPMAVQFLSRLLLLFFNVHATYRLGVAAERKLRGPTRSFLATYFFLITASQFHLPFYSSRMLPNVFALVPVVHSYADWFDGKSRRAAGWLVLATTVFRCDLLILLFTVGLTMLLRREMTVTQAAATGIQAGLIGIVATVPLDSILWGRFLWPEGEVFYFNTVLNRSSEWGISPWHWYATSALPRAMLLTALLLPYAFLRIPELLDSFELRKGVEQRGGDNAFPYRAWKAYIFDLQLLPYLLPVVAFVAIYSFLPHKEVRFAFAVFPMLNICAAYGLDRVHNVAFPAQEPGKEKNKRKGFSSFSSLILFIWGIAAIGITFIGSTIFLLVSRHNYPGGEAMTMLQKHVAEISPMGAKKDIEVYFDVAAAMRGISLFGQRAASLSGGEGLSWNFSKAGYEKENQVSSNSLARFTHLLTENEEQAGFHLVGISQGHPRFSFRQFRVVTTNAIFVHERNGWKRKPQGHKTKPS